MGRRFCQFAQSAFELPVADAGDCHSDGQEQGALITFVRGFGQNGISRGPSTTSALDSLLCGERRRQTEGARVNRRKFLVGAMATVGGAFHPALGYGAALDFEDGWSSLTFRNIAPTRFLSQGTRLNIEAEQSASVIYRLLGPEQQTASRAEWSWRVSRSVPATDLSRKGGDDRNIAVYFVFMEARAAARLRPDVRLTSLLANRSARIMISVWGGSHQIGAALASPYTRGRGYSVIARQAGTGEFSERLELRALYAQLFGEEPQALVGLAVSSDSDDTKSLVQAEISQFVLS
jgi:hypothetical protein